MNSLCCIFQRLSSCVFRANEIEMRDFNLPVTIGEVYGGHFAGFGCVRVRVARAFPNLPTPTYIFNIFCVFPVFAIFHIFCVTVIFS